MHVHNEERQRKDQISEDYVYVTEEMLQNVETIEENVENSEETEVHLRNDHEKLSCEETAFAVKSNESLTSINEEDSSEIQTEIYLKTESEKDRSRNIVFVNCTSPDDQMYLLVDDDPVEPEPAEQLTAHEERSENIKGTSTKVNNLDKLHICEICEKVFNRYSNLNAHLSSHTKDFACYVCCNSYASQFRLDQHITQHAEEDLVHFKDTPAVVQCQCSDQCKEVFFSKYTLSEHKKHHQNIVQYACDQCDKKFLTYRQLTSHKKRHDASAVCPVCGKVYSSDKILQQHLRLHSGEKPYECAVCKIKFRFQSGLSVHEKIHTGERNYKCGQCHKSFARSNYLKEHMRIHFNEKPFRCEFCEATFTQKNVLKTHVAKKHRHCALCQRHVGDALQLRMHIWKVHPEEHGMFGLDDNETVTETSVDGVMV